MRMDRRDAHGKGEFGWPATLTSGLRRPERGGGPSARRASSRAPQRRQPGASGTDFSGGFPPVGAAAPRPARFARDAIATLAWRPMGMVWLAAKKHLTQASA